METTTASRWAKSRVRRAARSAAPGAFIEGLESRTLFAVTTLSNGTGDGTVSVTVDAYGAFGDNGDPFWDATDANYDPVGGGGPSGTTFESGVYFSPIDQFLSESDIGDSDPLPSVQFTATTARTATSTFTLANGNFTVNLSQSLSPVVSGGSNLTQTYRVTNNTSSTQTIVMVRFFDGDLNFIGSLDNDFAGVSPDGRQVYEFDSAADPSQTAGFVSIRSTGGTFMGFTAQQFPYAEAIIAADGIPTGDRNQLQGDADNNRLTDNGFDVTLALQNNFTLAPGATISYQTITRFSQGAPADVTGAPIIQFSAAQYSRTESGEAIEITVNRLRNTETEATVNFTTLTGGTATPGVDFEAVSGTLTFAPGENSATFTIPIANDDFPEADETILIQLSNPSTGTQLGNPSQATVTIIDDTPFLGFQAPTFEVLENAGVINIIIERAGSTQGSATVVVNTNGGTATPGIDYTPLIDQVVTFANGQRTIAVPIAVTQDFDAEGDETIEVRLSSATGAALSTSTATVVTLLNFEPPPAVTGVQTVGVGAFIHEIVITYSTDLDPATAQHESNYDIYLRKERRLGGSPSRDRIALGSIIYDNASRTVTIEPLKPLKVNKWYELSVSGTRGRAIATPAGTRLDGNQDTTAGDDYRSYFARGNKIIYYDAQGDKVVLRPLNGGIIEVNRPVTRDDAIVTFIDPVPGATTLSGKFNIFRKRTDHKTNITLVNAAGVLRELPPSVLIEDADDIFGGGNQSGG